MNIEVLSKFTAQSAAGLSWIKLGMNSPSCPNNYKLFLNIIHWLDTGGN